MLWLIPAAWLVTSVGQKFCTTPPKTITTAATNAIGSRIRNDVRVRSTQKLPSRCVLARAMPRMRATTTTIPTAAERKFCTASRHICTKMPTVASGT
ncbi:hypothetical protein D3C85_1700070 [compost metagenome]